MVRLMTEITLAIPDRSVQLSVLSQFCRHFSVTEKAEVRRRGFQECPTDKTMFTMTGRTVPLGDGTVNNTARKALLILTMTIEAGLPSLAARGTRHTGCDKSRQENDDGKKHRRESNSLLFSIHDQLSSRCRALRSFFHTERLALITERCRNCLIISVRN